MSPSFKCSDCDKTIDAADVLTHRCNVGEELNTEAKLVVPDVIGEIMAFRSWYVDEEGRLQSLNSYEWPAQGYTIADCTHHSVEEVPVKTHTCGIYAAKDRAHLVAMRYNRYDLTRNVVVGDVALAGKIIPGTQGYRALKARPVKIYVPYEKWQLVTPIEKRYQIEVVLDNTLVAPKEVKN